MAKVEINKIVEYKATLTLEELEFLLSVLQNPYKYVEAEHEPTEEHQLRGCLFDALIVAKEHA